MPPTQPSSIPEQGIVPGPGKWSKYSTQCGTGKGIIDQPYKNGTNSETGIYQTFKTALYLLVLTRLSLTIPPGVIDSIARTHGPDRGFHTGYDQDSPYAGTRENIETTSLVIIVLTEQPPHQNLLFIATVLASSTALTLALFILHRRKPAAIAVPGGPASTPWRERWITRSYRCVYDFNLLRKLGTVIPMILCPL